MAADSVHSAHPDPGGPALRSEPPGRRSLLSEWRRPDVQLGHRTGRPAPPQPLRTDHHLDLQKHTLQHDHHAEPHWTHQAGGGRPGGPPVRSARQDRLQRRSPALPLLPLRAGLHHPGAAHTALSVPLRVGPRLRETDEDLQLQLAGEPRVFQVSRPRRRGLVRGGEHHLGRLHGCHAHSQCHQGHHPKAPDRSGESPPEHRIRMPRTVENAPRDGLRAKSWRKGWFSK